MKVTDVFTPNKPARLTFVERDSINNKLIDALQTPGKQVVVYGHSGSGKTTLLVNTLDRIFERHIITRCTKDLKFEQLVLHAFDELGQFYTSEISYAERNERTISLLQEYKIIKAQFVSKDSQDYVQKQQRVIPPQLTAQRLATFLGQAKCCWVLEDFHKIEAPEKTKLAQSMKLFMDMADQFSSLKIITIGAVATARQVIEYEPEMRNRVAEVHVPLMSQQEITQIIRKGELLLNISIHQTIKEGIVKYSNGSAGICHQLCLNVCNYMNIQVKVENHTNIHSPNVLKKALEKYIEQASDTLKSSFDKALRIGRKGGKFHNCELILKALVQHGEEGATSGEILQTIKRKTPNYPQGNLPSYLLQLTTPDRGSLIRQDNSSGKYFFVDPIYRFFAMAIFEETPKNNYIIHFRNPDYTDISFSDFTKIQEEVLKQLLREYTMK